MPKPIPFLFCRYQMLVDEEQLDRDGQYEALQSIKGQLFPHGPKATREGVHDILVMRPQKREIEGEQVLTWSVGHRPGVRRKTDYDAAADKLSHSIEHDTHTVYTDFIAVPRLGAMAVDDRVSGEYMGARPAISRLRSAFQNVEDGQFQAWLLAAGDVSAVLKELSLLEYAYSVRRYNPHAPGVLAKRTSDAMAEEGIGTLRGVARPMPGEEMRAAEGHIEGTSELAEAGYGVVGFRGTTDSGHVVHLPKPTFDLDKNKNLKEQEKPQRLRVYFERPEVPDEDMTPSIVRELVRFYDRDVDNAPPILAEPA